MNIQELRKQYPDYNDMTDEQFAQGFHKKFYSDMDFSEFSKKIGYGTKAPETTWQEDVKIGWANAGNTLTKGVGILGGGLASLVDTDTADKIYDQMNKVVKEREEWANPEKKQQSFGGKVIGTVASLPAQLAAMPFSPADTGKTMIDNNESLETAQTGALLDTAGNVVGAALPGAIGGNLLKRFASGAAINAGQDWLTRLGLENIAEQQKTKQEFAPTWETAALAGIVGGPMGMLSPGSRPETVSETQPKVTPEVEQTGKQITDKLLTAHGERLVKSIAGYDEQITALQESGNLSPEIIKFIEELEAARQHDSDTLKSVQEALGGKDNKTAVIKEVQRKESERIAREQLGAGKNRSTGPDVEIPLEAYERDINLARDNLPPTREVPKSRAELETELQELKTTKFKRDELLSAMDRRVEVEAQLAKMDEDLRDLEQTPVETPLPKIEGLEQPTDVGVIKTGTWEEPGQLSLPEIKERQQAAQLDRMDANVEAMNREIPGFTKEELAARGVEPKRYDEVLQKEPEVGIKDPDVGFNIALKNIDSNTREIQKLQEKLQAYANGLIPSGTLDVAQIQAQIARHEHFVERFENMRDFYQAKMGKKTETKEVKLAKAKEETAPTKYNSVEELMIDNENSGRVSKALIDNPELVSQVPKTQIFFDKRLPRDTQNMVRSLLSLTQMGKERVIVLMDNEMAPAGRALLEGNTTIIRLNPQKLQENLQRVEETKFFNTIPGVQQMRSAVRMLNEVRYYTHEIGHAIFFKYIRDSVTHLDDLKNMYKDWNNLVAENKGKFEVNSLFDAAKDPKYENIRKEYQSSFTEYFAERVARQLMHEHILGKFSKYKAIGDIKKIIDASANYLKSKGIDLNKKNFTDAILQDILKGNKDYIRDMSKEADARVKLLQDDAAITKAKFQDAEAFPFYKKTISEVREKMADWSVDKDPLLEGLGYGQNIFPEKAAKALGDDIKDPTHRPMSIKTAAYIGGNWVAKNFFGKNYVAKIFKDNPQIAQAYKTIRNAERLSSEILSKQWFGDVSRADWDKAGILKQISKVKSDESAYKILKDAKAEDASAVLDVFEYGFRDELDYADNLKVNGGHLTPEQTKFYNKMAELFKSQYDESVKVQEALGKKNILPHRKGWFPAVRTGPYSVAISFAGDMVHRQNFRSKAEADLFRKKFEKETGGTFEIGEAVYYKDSNPITQDMFRTIDMVENIIKQQYGDAVAKPIHDRIEASLQKIITTGGKLGGHHNYRSNLSGYMGSEFFTSRQERGEAFKKAIQSSVNEYAGGLRNMYITTHTDMLLKQHPENSVLQEMVTSAKNRTENKLNSVDDAIRNTWDKALLAVTGEIPANNRRSFDSVYNAGLEFFYLTKLMSKLIFPVNQALAFTQSIRQMSYDGGFLRPYLAMGKGMFDLISSNEELKNQIYEVSTKTNTFEPQFIENLHLTQGNNKLWEGIKKYGLLQRVNESADSLSRVIAFSSAYRMYRDMGMSEAEAQTRAIDITDTSMVAYGKTEIAPMFNKAGVIGQSMKPLQTFGQAQLGNVVSDLKHMKTLEPKTWAPFVNYALVSTMMAGTVSLVFVQEYEMIRKYLNANWPKYFNLPSVYDIIKQDMSFLDRVVTTPEEVKEAAKITAQYGVLANTGIDVMSSSRSNETLISVLAATISGQKAGYEIAPLLDITVKGLAGAATVVQTAVSDKKSAEVRKALTDIAPSGHFGFLAKEIAGVNTTKSAGDRTNMVAGGSDNDAIKARTWQDVVGNFAGAKSTQERKITDVSRIQTERDKQLDQYRNSLLSKFADTGDKRYIEDLASTGLDSSEIESMIQSKLIKRNMGIPQRAAAKSSGEPISTVDEFKKLQAYKEAGLFK